MHRGREAIPPPTFRTRDVGGTMKRKVTLVGAGSRYFEFVIAEIATTESLRGFELMLFDVDRKRMDLIKKVAYRILEKTGAKLTIRSTTQLARALDGADFAVSSIGVHGPDAAWHALDSQVAARFGIIHTTGDTVGPGGISQGLRIIPVYMKIARAMEKYCPNVILLNHSNPMNPICRAIMKNTSIRVIGYCHNVSNDVHFFSRVLGIPYNELEVTIAGPNHMCWLLELRHNGKDMIPVLKRRLARMDAGLGHRLAAEMFDLLGVFPVGGDRHMIEFYPHARRYKSPKRVEYGLKWRAQAIKEHLLAKEISREPDELELRAAGEKDPWLPEVPTAEAMGRQIEAMATGREIIHFVNTPNRGAVPNLPDWAVIEQKAVIGSQGARPVYAGELPPQAARWTLAHIYAQELLVDAAVEGSRRKALQAMACDSMIRDFKEAVEVFDAIVEAQGERLKRFRK